MSVRTVSVLRDIGFKVDSSIPADFIGGGLRYDFPNLELEACACTTIRNGPVILFTGVAGDTRTLCEVMFEMPQEVESFELGIAWLTFVLDSQARGLINPGPKEYWMIAGREHSSLLPWERRQAAYNARPSCTVEREWMRLALKKLQDIVDDLPGSSLVQFHHDGEVLRIRAGDRTVVVGAQGIAWNGAVSVHAEALRRLPSRLPAHGLVEIGVWEGRLTLHRYSYNLVQEDTSGE